MADELVKQALIAELSAARQQLVVEGIEVRRGLSITGMVKRTVQAHPVVSYAGAVVVGLVLARVLTRKRSAPLPTRSARMSETTEKAGKAAIGLTALKFALDFAKPAMLRWTTQWVSNRFTPQHRGAAGATAQRRDV